MTMLDGIQNTTSPSQSSIVGVCECAVAGLCEWLVVGGEGGGGQSNF